MSEWRDIPTAPRDELALFWIVPKTQEEFGFHDTSGNPIKVPNTPEYPEYCKYGQWASFSKATHWMRIERPVTSPPPPAETEARK